MFGRASILAVITSRPTVPQMSCRVLAAVAINGDLNRRATVLGLHGANVSVSNHLAKFLHTGQFLFLLNTLQDFIDHILRSSEDLIRILDPGTESGPFVAMFEANCKQTGNLSRGSVDERLQLGAVAKVLKIFGPLEGKGIVVLGADAWLFLARRPRNAGADERRESYCVAHCVDAVSWSCRSKDGSEKNAQLRWETH
jgi:hypothetical protein